MFTHTVYFKQISTCFGVFVEGIICYGELKDDFPHPSFQSAPLSPKASPSTKKLKRACTKSFQHFDTLDSLNPRSIDDTNFIA